MKKVLLLLLAMIMVVAFTACGEGSTDEAKSDDQKAVAEATTEAATEVTTEAATSDVDDKVERDLPEGDYEEVGDGTFYLTGPSGSTENGDEIIIYPDMDSWPHAYVGIELWDMDGSVQTYIYVDGVEMDKEQVGAGYQGDIDFDDDSLWAITDGEHEVEAVQYADNDSSKDITFFRALKYTVKNN